MARWPDLKQYIETKYPIKDDKGDLVNLIFTFPDDNNRSQIVTIGLRTLNGEEWVTIDSPIGKMSEVDVTRAVQLAGNLVCGAISSVQDWVTLRDSFPIANLDTNEFEAPLHFICGTADDLEKELTGGADRV
jgi:hypothetical protein